MIETLLTAMSIAAVIMLVSFGLAVFVGRTISIHPEITSDEATDTDGDRPDDGPDERKAA